MCHTNGIDKPMRIAEEIQKDELDEIWKDCMFIRDFDELTEFGKQLLSDAEAVYEKNRWERPARESDGFRIEDFD